jgi:hypothetical protein
MTKNKKTLGIIDFEFLCTPTVVYIIADFDNSTHYGKNIGRKHVSREVYYAAQLVSLQASTKYHVVTVNYENTDRFFLEWLYNCNKFVYIADVNCIHFGFIKRNDAIMCKLRFCN